MPTSPEPSPSQPASALPTPAPQAVQQQLAGGGDTASPPLESPLAWAPPVLSSPIVVQVSDTSRALVLDPTRDYLVQMPTAPLVAKGGLTISGGHNVVLIGGEIDIPNQGDPPPADSRRALYLKGQTGTVHVEGVRMTGPDITEGIDLDERLGAIVQLENIRIEDIHARDEVGFTDNHPDLVQTWAGPAELRVDYLSGSSDYQGFFLNPMQYGTQAPPRLFDFRHVNIVGTSTAGYLLWQTSPFPLALSDVWVQPNPRKTLSRTLWPNVTTWPGVNQGVPAGGDFVPDGSAGAAYSSPGYPATR